MPSLVFDSVSVTTNIHDQYEVARRLARRRLWSRGWSAQDVEDAAADAIVALRVAPAAFASKEEVLRVMSQAVDAYRARERRARMRNVYFDEPGAFDRAVEQVATEEPTEAAKESEAKRLEIRTRYCRSLVQSPKILRRVRVVTLLATICQIAPTLAGKELVEQALQASRNGRGILRSPESFRSELAHACSELSRAMKRNPRAKQFPDQIRQLAWVFRGQDDEPYEAVSPARMATMVNWLYQARARGEARLQAIVGPVRHFLAPTV